MNGLPLIDHVNVTGPYNPTGPGDTPSRRRVFSCKPGESGRGNGLREDDSVDHGAARLSPPGDRGRHGADHGDLRGGPEEGQLRRRRSSRACGWCSPIRSSCSAPRRRRRPAPRASAISSSRRACRSSSGARFPTTTLLTLAAQNRLSQPAVLDAAGAADARGSEVAGAGGQLREPVADAAQPEEPHPDAAATFPTSTTSCGRRSGTETEMFVESIMREDRSVLDLLNADYTFVNERLARHYGIPNVYGSHFRRVTLKGEERRGLLGQGSILTVTSYPNRTSPVLRGKWHPREHPRHAAVAAAAERADAQGEQAGRGAEVASRAAGAAPHATRRAPAATASWTRSASRWRTSTASASGASRKLGGAVDPTGQLADGAPIDGPAGAAQGDPEAAGNVRAHADREADDLWARTRRRTQGQAARARHRARRGAQNYRFSIDRAGHREEHAVPDEEGANHDATNITALRIALSMYWLSVRLQPDRRRASCSSRRSTCPGERSCVGWV